MLLFAGGKVFPPRAYCVGRSPFCGGARNAPALPRSLQPGNLRQAPHTPIGAFPNGLRSQEPSRHGVVR